MVPVLSLLIPIVVSAVFVFIASSVIHMATPWSAWRSIQARSRSTSIPRQEAAAWSQCSRC